MIGETILHYKILEKLGEGGMGVVYLAMDTKLKREVAIKFLPNLISADKEEKIRFENEAQTAASLKHPNVTTIYAVEESDEKTFIVMELIEGKELKEIVKSGLPNKETAISYAVQIAEGLQAAHKKGIIHRDIKSSNIMVTDEGQIKIMDFGLAKLSGGTEIDGAGTTVGTASYLSPEQANGEEVDERSDLWSFGVVLCEMVTGKLPFQGDYEQAVIYSILNEESSVVTTIDPELRRIIVKALSKDPEKRYQTAGEIINDLKKLKEASNGKPRLIPDISKTYRYIGGIVLAAALMFLAYLIIKPGSEQETTKTIAVLPFEDLSPNKDQAYLSDGLSEELMNVLAQNPGLRVISRNSAFSFVGTKTSLKTIADKLNVQYILEGSVSRSGNQFRITAELVDVTTDAYKWSRTYNEQAKDIITLQDSISKSVAEALNVALLGEGHPAPMVEKNPEAYNYFLQGKYFSRQLTKQSLETAIGFFKKALQIDPDYAQAWAGLSTTHSNQAGFGYIPLEKGYQEARTEAEKSMELDPDLPVAYNALGWIKQYYDWDWIGADSVYTKAMNLAPENAGIVESLAQLSATLGQFDTALKLDQKAVRLDPVSTAARFLLGFHAYYAGKYAEAIASFREEIKMNSAIPQVHTYMGLVYLKKHDLDSAQKMIAKEVDPFWKAYGLALLNFAMNKIGDSDKELAEIIKEDQNDSAFQIAEIYAFRGETDEAFHWLERAYKQRDSGLAEIKGDPLLSSIVKDKRYDAFLTKMNLPVQEHI
jgi:serine/threonine protein kinase/Tfp pilus assembly protein PilF